MAYAYTGRNTALYYSSPQEIVTKGNFLPSDVRSDWEEDVNEADLDAHLISTLIIIKDIVDRDRNINFTNESNGVPEVIHLASTFLGYFIIRDESNTQDGYIKDNEEIRIYTSSKMFDQNVRELLNSIPKRVKDGYGQNIIRMKAMRSNVDDYNPYNIIKWY